MSPTTTRWVLWIALLVLIPVPVFDQRWGWLPAASLVHFALGARAFPGIAAVLQLLVGALILGALTHMYCRWSAPWQAKIRGSITALFVFTLLIVFSSVPVYRLPGAASPTLLTLPWLYE